VAFVKTANQRFVPGTSRGRENLSTFLAQMAESELQRRRKAMRRQHGMTQPEVAEAIGYGLRSYQKWEAGGGMRPKHRRKLAALWGIPIGELGGDEEMNSTGLATTADIERIEARLLELQEEMVRLLSDQMRQDPSAGRGQG